MTRYAATSIDSSNSAASRGSYLRVSFKNTRETAQAVSGWQVNKALQYLEAVSEKKRAIPFRRFNGSIGRTAQGKEFGVTKARWPVKSVKFVSDLIQNAVVNAEAKGLDASSLYIKHIQVNQAPKMRRRTYRAHGRINAYKSSPCHIEIILAPETESIPAAEEEKQVATA